MQILQSGGGRREYKIHAVAVYEKKTGKIRHVHHEALFADSKAPSATALAARALAHAKNAGRDVTQLAALPLKELPKAGVYRVDLKSKALVLTAAVPPRRSKTT